MDVLLAVLLVHLKIDLQTLVLPTCIDELANPEEY